MKIALLGTRGIPARYSGFETFYEQLAWRLVKKGHDVTVYNRSNVIKTDLGFYKGVRIVSVPSIKTKHLDTISHTFISTFHVLLKKYDIVYYCIVGNSPLIWLPRLRRAKTLLNVDGEDWAREKWTGFARWYQKKCERIATKTANAIISDSGAIKERYRKKYGVDTVYVPYGANLEIDTENDVLNQWGLEKRKYILFVGRLVPENSIHLLIHAFEKVRTPMKLVIVGGAPYMDKYIRQLKNTDDKRILFTGFQFDRNYVQLSSHAYVYVQPSNIEGTRPALLDQLGFGNCVLVRGNAANKEVIQDCGLSFDGVNYEDDLKAKLEELIASPKTVERYREKARSRIEKYYNWEWITDFYEDLFERLSKGRPLESYNEYLAKRKI